MRISTIVKRFGIVRTDRHCPLETRDRRLMTSEVVQRSAVVVPSLRAERTQLERATVVLERRFVLTRARLDHGEEVHRIERRRRGTNRRTAEVFGLADATRSPGGESEV